MSASPLSLLLCTNGLDSTLPSIQYGIWLSGLLSAPVTLLGVIESEDLRPQVEQVVASTSHQLEENRIAYQVKYDRGRGSLVIARHAAAGNFISVVGPLGRPAWRRMFQGRSFRRLLAKIASPLLYVPSARLPLTHILLCMGGLGYALSVEHLALHLARAVGARITLLHVVEPVSLDYPVAREIQDHWEGILHTRTPQGENLRQALDELVRGGIDATFKVRHGSAVNEILSEVNQGDYDLIAMGSAYSAHSLRHLYLPNVTAEVAEVVGRPVLTVRPGHEGPFLPS